eukprot:763617-Rhodomonas_salina.2
MLMVRSASMALDGSCSDAKHAEDSEEQAVAMWRRGPVLVKLADAPNGHDPHDASIVMSLAQSCPVSGLLRSLLQNMSSGVYLAASGGAAGATAA